MRRGRSGGSGEGSRGWGAAGAGGGGGGGGGGVGRGREVVLGEDGGGVVAGVEVDGVEQIAVRGDGGRIEVDGAAAERDGLLDLPGVEKGHGEITEGGDGAG